MTIYKARAAATNARAAASSLAIIIMLSAAPAHAQEGKSAFASTWQSVKEFFQPAPKPETIEPAAGVEQTTAGTNEMLQVPPPYMGPEAIEPAAGDEAPAANPPAVIYPDGVTPGPQSSIDDDNTNGFGGKAGLAFANDEQQIVTAFGDNLPSIEDLTNIMPAAGDAEAVVTEGAALQTSTTTVDDEGTETTTTSTTTSAPTALDAQEAEDLAPSYSANDCVTVLRAASVGGRGTPDPALIETCKNKLNPPDRSKGDAEITTVPPEPERTEGNGAVKEKSLFDKLKDAVTPDAKEEAPAKAAEPAATPATTPAATDE